MPTSDKFIQSMVELLDKLIENQSKNASLLSEIKFSLAELREEQDSILTNLREKLPDQIIREQEEYYNKLSIVISKIETANSRLADNIRTFEQDNVFVKSNIDKNSKTLEEYALLLKEMKKTLEEKDSNKKELEETLKEVKNFVEFVKNKKAWAAIIIAAITALGTMIAAVFTGVESINKNIDSKKQSIIKSLPQNPTNP